MVTVVSGYSPSGGEPFKKDLTHRPGYRERRNTNRANRILSSNSHTISIQISQQETEKALGSLAEKRMYLLGAYCVLYCARKVREDHEHMVIATRASCKIIKCNKILNSTFVSGERILELKADQRKAQQAFAKSWADLTIAIRTLHIITSEQSPKGILIPVKCKFRGKDALDNLLKEIRYDDNFPSHPMLGFRRIDFPGADFTNSRVGNITKAAKSYSSEPESLRHTIYAQLSIYRNLSMHKPRQGNIIEEVVGIYHALASTLRCDI